MSSLGKATKRAFFKAANDGGSKKHVVADLKKAKHVADPTENQKSQRVFDQMDKANDNGLDPKKYAAKAHADNAVMAKLFELVDEGNQFALNKYAKKHFGKTWKELKQYASIKDMV